MKLYATEEKAYRRVGVLRRLGIWPGVIRHGDKWRLSYDPELA